MDVTVEYYKVNLTGNVNNCLSCSLEKIRKNNIRKKNEDKSEYPGERMYLDISSMRKPSMGGRQHLIMLVDEATRYKKSAPPHPPPKKEHDFIQSSKSFRSCIHLSSCLKWTLHINLVAVIFPKFESAGTPVRPFEYLDVPILIIARAPFTHACNAHA